VQEMLLSQMRSPGGSTIINALQLDDELAAALFSFSVFSKQTKHGTTV